LAQDADGNVWWYTGTQSGGLSQVSLLGSWVHPNSPFLGNPAPPAAIPPGVIGVAGGMAAVPQPQQGVNNGEWIIEITIRIRIIPPGNKPGAAPGLLPPRDPNDPQFPPIAPIPVVPPPSKAKPGDPVPPPPPGGSPGDPVKPSVPSKDPVPPLPGEKKM
jgi:hypothetical protein